MIKLVKVEDVEGTAAVFSQEARPKGFPKASPRFLARTVIRCASRTPPTSNMAKPSCIDTTRNLTTWPENDMDMYDFPLISSIKIYQNANFWSPFLDDSWSLSRLLITSWVMIIHDDRDRRRQYHCLHHQNARARCCWSFAALLWTDTVKYLLQSVG